MKEKRNTFKNIGGSIFRNNKQMLVIVRVECSERTRDTIAEKICELLNEKHIDFSTGKKE